MNSGNISHHKTKTEWRVFNGDNLVDNQVSIMTDAGVRIVLVKVESWFKGGMCGSSVTPVFINDMNVYPDN